MTRGQVGIARLGESYEIIPRVIAEKLLEREANSVIKMPEKAKPTATQDDDPYADYPIPDDLMW